MQEDVENYEQQRAHYLRRANFVKAIMVLYFVGLGFYAVWTGNWNYFLECLPFAIVVFPGYEKIQLFICGHKNGSGIQFFISALIASIALIVGISMKSGIANSLAVAIPLITLWLAVGFLLIWCDGKWQSH